MLSCKARKKEWPHNRNSANFVTQPLALIIARQLLFVTALTIGPPILLLSQCSSDNTVTADIAATQNTYIIALTHGPVAGVTQEMLGVPERLQRLHTAHTQAISQQIANAQRHKSTYNGPLIFSLHARHIFACVPPKRVRKSASQYGLPSFCKILPVKGWPQWAHTKQSWSRARFASVHSATYTRVRVCVTR